MLYLTRRFGESLVIGDNIKITFTKTRYRGVRLHIDAPKDVRIVRAELLSNRKEDKNDAENNQTNQ